MEALEEARAAARESIHALKAKVEPAAANQAAAIKSRQAAEASLAETRQALQAERQKRGLLERDLTAARGSIEELQAKVEPAAAEQANAVKARQAAEASLEKTRQALEAERQKARLLERDLGAARGSIEALQAKVEPAAAEQANAIKARQAAEASLEKTRQALEAERQKARLLERDLGAARGSIEALQAKVEPAAAEQAAAVESRQAAEASLAETRRALEAERQKAGLLKHDLAAARGSIEKLQTKVEPTATAQAAAVKSQQVAEASLAQTMQALEEERQKAGLLERSLAAARGSIQELQTKVNRLQSEAVKSRQAAEASLEEIRQALKEERQKSGLLKRDLAAARGSIEKLQAKVEPAPDRRAPFRAGRGAKPRWRRPSWLGRRLLERGREKFANSKAANPRRQRGGPRSCCPWNCFQPGRLFLPIGSTGVPRPEKQKAKSTKGTRICNLITDALLTAPRSFAAVDQNGRAVVDADRTDRPMTPQQTMDAGGSKKRSKLKAGPRRGTISSDARQFKCCYQRGRPHQAGTGT